MLVGSDDELDRVYFLHSGAVAFMIDMPDRQAVDGGGTARWACCLSVLGPLRSSVTAIVRVAGTAS
ncbi:hypothetical protein MTX20_00590 (plasmid) [Bradyrhizobium sp. ISRA435]|nr:hypothetical protein MTX20_00590 [Bradyrhizobium sp. ISRA435]